MRFDDLRSTGRALSVKGTVETDGTGDIQAANLPSFNLSDGDKATLRAERGPDGALRVTVRGDVYDGRSFVKSSMSGPTPAQAKNAQAHGHRCRRQDRRGRRASTARRCAASICGCRAATAASAASRCSAKLGRDTPLIGDLRGRAGGRNVHLCRDQRCRRAVPLHRHLSEHFRRRDVDGDGPADRQDNAPQDGILNIRDFTIRGEAALDRVASGNAEVTGSTDASNPASNSRGCGSSSRARTGRFAIRDGVVRGPMIGATVEGHIDYLRDEVRMRGTFVPFFGLNNMFGQIPIVGLFLGGGSNEGLRRHHLRGGRPAGRAGAARQSDLGGGAGPAAQVLRIPRHSSGERRAARALAQRADQVR